VSGGYRLALAAGMVITPYLIQNFSPSDGGPTGLDNGINPNVILNAFGDVLKRKRTDVAFEADGHKCQDGYRLELADHILSRWLIQNLQQLETNWAICNGLAVLLDCSPLSVSKIKIRPLL
jgi:hypothetical protein